MENTILKCTNSKKFIDFLNRFKSIDSNVLLEINGTDTITAKSFIQSKTAVKFGSVNFSDVFELSPKSTIPEKLLIGIYNIDRMSKIFSNIDEESMDFNLEYKENNTDKEFNGIFVDKFIIKSPTIKINVPCGEKEFYSSMSDDILDGVFDVSDSVYKFKLEPKLLDKLLALSNLEATDGIKFSILENKKGKSLVFSGRNYNLKYQDEFESSENEFEISINKDYFKYLDKENYIVQGTDENMFFFTDDVFDMKIALGALVEASYNE